MCYIGSELWESKFDRLFSLVRECFCRYVGNMETNYTIVTQDPVNNSILILHLGIWLWLMGRGE